MSACPTCSLAVPAYYVIAPAEASSNLSRFDGVRYGYRAPDYADLNDMYARAAREGFGAEVKRRILIGTYVLSHGYYDAYYLQAQKHPPPDRRTTSRRVQAMRRDHGADHARPPPSDSARKSTTRCRCICPTSTPSPSTSPACPACRCPAASARRAAGRPAAHRQLFRRSAHAQRRAPLSAGDRLAPALPGAALPEPSCMRFASGAYRPSCSPPAPSPPAPCRRRSRRGAGAESQRHCRPSRQRRSCHASSRKPLKISARTQPETDPRRRALEVRTRCSFHDVAGGERQDGRAGERRPKSKRFVAEVNDPETGYLPLRPEEFPADREACRPSCSTDATDGCVVPHVGAGEGLSRSRFNGCQGNAPATPSAISGRSWSIPDRPQ